MTAAVVRREEGTHHPMTDGDHIRKAALRDAQGGFEVFEVRAPAQAPTPPHISPWGGVLYLLEGRVRAFRDGREYLLEPGDVVVFPAGVPATFGVESDAARMLAITTGDGAGRFFADFATSVDPERPVTETMPDILSVTARHGVRMADA